MTHMVFTSYRFSVAESVFPFPTPAFSLGAGGWEGEWAGE